jgi:hypothetical protein
MLELKFWVKTHIFFGTLVGGVVQKNVHFNGYWQQPACRFLTLGGWCIRGWGEVGRGQLITAHITVVRHVYRLWNQCKTRTEDDILEPIVMRLRRAIRIASCRWQR